MRDWLPRPLRLTRSKSCVHTYAINPTTNLIRDSKDLGLDLVPHRMSRSPDSPNPRKGWLC